MYVAEKSAGQRSTYTFGLGSLLYVAKNLQARNLRTGEKREHRWGGTWSPGKTDGGRWWERYLVRSLYVVDTVRTREVRTMAIWCLRGESMGEGTVEGCTVDMLLCCGHVIVLVTADRLPSSQWCGEHHRSHSVVTGILWPLSVFPDHHCVPFSIKRNYDSTRYVRSFYGLQYHVYSTTCVSFFLPEYYYTGGCT